ncbi:hypothetical protein [Cytobacillus sp. IB215665]|uniref:hypothetical protein n=1 Tax=Cytobacillus sp. IB215665 TaxID=3097357 RepID=UPI002A15B739|nr:hypothetical protein [Cytobacillus sp. IB215665]MDX8368003.1 hypothetical protein [Cytobacillus sp. IB215665]
MYQLYEMNISHQRNIERIEERIFRTSIKNIGAKQLYDIGETLELYNEGFNDTEQALFTNALNKDIRKINQDGGDLAYLQQLEGIDLLYYEHIWQIENLLIDISSRSISNNDIHSIATIMKKHSDSFREIFYEEGISPEEFNTEENIDRITNILVQLNKDIEMVLDR